MKHCARISAIGFTRLEREEGKNNGSSAAGVKFVGSRVENKVGSNCSEASITIPAI